MVNNKKKTNITINYQHLLVQKYTTMYVLGVIIIKMSTYGRRYCPCGKQTLSYRDDKQNRVIRDYSCGFWVFQSQPKKFILNGFLFFYSGSALSGLRVIRP